MNENPEMVATLFKYAVIVLGLLLLVFVIAVLTPWLAKQFDKLRKNPERVDKKGSYDFQKDELTGLFQADENNTIKKEDDNE